MLRATRFTARRSHGLLEGIKTLLDRAKGLFPRLSHLWMDAGYSGEDKGGDWVEKTLGWTVEIVRRPRKPAPEEVLMAWAREWAKEGVTVESGIGSCHRRGSSSCRGAG